MQCNFDTEEEAAFGLALNYANQVADCNIYILHGAVYELLKQLLLAFILWGEWK